MAIQAFYLHVPFCASKCLYCDFESRACHDASAFDAYAEAVVAWLARAGERGILSAVETAYIGGGTPSVLGTRLVRIVEAIRRAAPGIVELSCEANPESFDGALAGALHGAGATRVSLGVQSLVDHELKRLGRIHTARRACEAVRAAQRSGLNVSVDLMCGIPDETLESFGGVLDEVCALGVDHVSVYPLTIEEGTPFSRQVEAGRMPEPDEDLQAGCMELARDRLMRAGLAPYEVASYARPGHACRHNIAYWTGVSYLGVGRSAASMLDRATHDELRDALDLPELDTEPDAAVRIRFVERTDALPGDARCSFNIEVLSAREAVAEDLMLGMRMTRGVAAEALENAAGVLGEDAVAYAVDTALAEGLAAWRGAGCKRRLAPTRRGWLMGNELFELFWDLA